MSTSPNPAVLADYKVRVIALNEQIAKARHAYYVENKPVMSDMKFDSIERELKSILKTFPELAQFAPEATKVGSDLNGGKRIKHYRPMVSIENHYTEEDFLSWYQTQALDGNNVVVAEPKFDGISVSLFYENGKLIRALTRGDGESGEEITEAVYHTDVPVLLTGNMPKFFEVRGELVMRNSTLEKINAKLTAAGQKTYMSTRNLTAGTMKQKDTSNIADRHITIQPWDAIEYETKTLPASRLDRLQMLALSGFSAPLGIRCSNRAELEAALQRMLAANKTRDINCDGVVVKIDDTNVCAALGNGSNYANFQICFKPQSASGITTLNRVVWQIGRTGKLTPVAECDPVVLAGAEVRRAALCNITYIRDLGLSIGAKIEMLRSGDVIPQVVKVIADGPTEIKVPTHCPECHSKLETLDETGIETSWCVNAECPGRVRDLFAFIGDRDILEVDGLGPEMATKLASEGLARTVAELFMFGNEAAAGITKFGEDKFVQIMRKKGFSSTVVNMVASLEKAKKASWERWIACLNIPLVSKSLGKIIAKEVKLTADSMQNLPSALKAFAQMNIAGMGQRKKELILDWVADPKNVQLCADLYTAGVRPAPVAGSVVSAAGTPLAGIAFCITGEMPEMDRDKLSALLESLGAVKKSGVSKKTTHLIKLDAPGRSKIADAEKHGVPIVDKQWVIEQLAKGGIKLGNTARFPVED